MTAEPSKECTGGLCFEVVLKPANCNNLPDIINNVQSPCKVLSHEDIEKKLKDAEERRLANEANRLAFALKNKDRCQEVTKRLNDLNESFIKQTELKLNKNLEITFENKMARIKELQERLKEHAQKVDDIRNLGDNFKEDLKERIERKLEIAGVKRMAELNKIQNRIKQHEEHIKEVIQASNEYGKDTEEKSIRKMEISLKNREERLKVILDRLRNHNKKINELKQNKSPNGSSSENSFADETIDQEIDDINDKTDDLIIIKNEKSFDAESKTDIKMDDETKMNENHQS